MLKEKIYETIVSNQYYQNAYPTDEPSSYSMRTTELEENPDDENEDIVEDNDFKSAILRVIKANQYFKHVITAECDEVEEDDNDYAEIASFVSIDNKVLMSADNKIIAFKK